jgi:hypothetical protein
VNGTSDNIVNRLTASGATAAGVLGVVRPIYGTDDAENKIVRARGSD